MMELLADTHLHLYSCYDLDYAFSGLIDRLVAHNPQAVFAAFLAERSGYNFYEHLQTGEKILRDFVIEHAGNNLVLRRKKDARCLTVLPGRQIIAAENIEVLALCTDALFADGIPAAELIKLILKKNGVPVLPWSPGKWFFQRGKVIDHLLHSFTPQNFLIGDVSLRPHGWPLPLLMRKAKRLGYQIISGSDPLPFPGQEAQFGRYASRIISTEQKLGPDDTLRSLLAGKAEAISIGQRASLLELFKRLRYNRQVRRGQEKHLSDEI
ncbi:MAG: hypothetical protein CDV28_1043 [Candidatus Electronema aureum]|uniref:Uncharacterized protein n=1 Tax=Candidatus Electronema aureum TaxID=2005002 RepID=A0A521G3Q4_9BACT|nr:MAG: hypothetical protein CDV28_1043 [Candidatus Electronema aureum]